jgi:hypothetical protein
MFVTFKFFNEKLCKKGICNYLENVKIYLFNFKI